MKVTNAVIMAAGTSSRFAPISYEMPKALITVRGEVLVERQIRQLKEAGIADITLVTGYMAEKFEYLKGKFGVKLVHNPDYLARNNNSSILRVKDVLKNTYICSADNYFAENPFESEVDEAYYSVVYAEGHTDEWCLTEDSDGYINSVTVGGRDAWYMLGHAFWSEEFSRRFIAILEAEYDLPETAGLLWEAIYQNHLDELKLKIRKYPDGEIFEFDTLDELRVFDPSFIDDPHSVILKDISNRLNIPISCMHGFKEIKNDTNEASGFEFTADGRLYAFEYLVLEPEDEEEE